MKLFKFKTILTIAVVAGAVYGYYRYASDWNLPTFGQIADGIREKFQAVSEMEQPNYKLDEGVNFSQQYDTKEGDVPYTKIDMPEGFHPQGVQKLKLEAAGCVVKFEASEDEDFHVKAVGCKKIQYYVEKATLHVTVTGGITAGAAISDGIKNTVLTLYYPANTLQISFEAQLGAGGMEFENIVSQYVALKCGAGRMEVGEIDADELKIDLDAGAVSVKKASTGKITAKTGMGSLNIASLVFDSGLVSCSMGNVDITVQGAEKDYNYEVKAAGLVKVGETEFKGITGEKKVANGARETLRLECSVGNVQIRFETP